MIALQLNSYSQEPPPPDPAVETRRLLEAMLGELPDPYAAVLRVVELEGLNFADTASSMGLREASVRLLYREGRRRLRAVVLAHTETP